ncbi:hypothetical protein MBLNU13_g11356t1 [Cladosporium sp. NU13]
MSPDVEVCDIIERLGLAIEHETAQMTFNHFEMHILCSKMLRQLHVAIGPSIHNWLENYRDDRHPTGIVLAIFLEATEGQPVAFKAGELVTSFVAQNGELAMRDTQMIDAVKASRRANVSNGVAGHGDTGHLLNS